MKFFSIISFIFILLTSACSSGDSKKAPEDTNINTDANTNIELGGFTYEANKIDDQATAYNQLETLISTATSQRNEDSSLKKENMPALISHTLGVINKFPTDKKTKDFAFNVAEILNYAEDYENSARMFQLVVKTFPKSDQTGHAQFQLARVLQKGLDDKNAAIATFRAFLKDYPNHPLAGPAEGILFGLTNK